MPLYEFVCRDCRSEFELLVRGSEEPQCPRCESRELEKLLSAPAAHTTAVHELPLCHAPARGGCGLPQCGMGSCAME